MPQNADISKLPIQRLLEQLAAADFEITAHEWYRTELALTKHQSLLYSSEGLEELGLILGPLLCKNEKEQKRFTGIYQEFLQKLSEDIPQDTSTDTSNPELKQAAWWLPLLLSLGFLSILYLVVNWYQNNYEDARNSNRFQYEVIGDLDRFNLGDTLQLRSQTSTKDSATHDFYWYIKGENEQVRWEHKGYAYQDLVFDNPAGINHSLQLIVRKKDAETQVFSKTIQQFRVNCAAPPIIKDIIEVEGIPKVGEPLQFSVETEGSGFAYQWDVGTDSLLTEAQPSWTFTEAGKYPVQLSLVDTTGQLGYCTTQIGTNVEIEEDQPKPTLVDLPTLILQKDESNLAFSFSNWIYLLLGFLLLASAFFWWLWDRQRKQFSTRQEEQRKAQIEALQVVDRAPYQIPFRGHSDEIQKGSLPFQMGNILRRRQEGSRQILDIPHTIQQTVEGGGFLNLQYRLNTRPTDYLFLIDQASSKSHLARLFLYLTQTLRDQDVHVDYWTCRGSFDRFWNPQHQGYADLNQLQKAFGDRKLIIFGNGEDLLDTNRAKDQLDTLGKWKYRILVTPKPLVSWSSKEKRLYQSFPIFPADLENLMEAAQLIEREWEADDLPAYFADWKKQFARQQPEDPDSETRLKRWSQYRNYLEQHPQLLPWIKSLVVHPELRWDLTIALGKATGAPVTFDNLLILSRIPAFEEGAFPIKVWRSIWDQLDLEQEWRARQAIKTELAAIPENVVEGSYAAQKIETDLDIQNFALDPFDKGHQKAIQLRMAAGQIDPQRLEELDLVVSRQTDTVIETKERGHATETFLEAEEKIEKPPQLTPYFWIASVFTLLTVLFLAARLLVNPQTIGAYFQEENKGLPFYLEMQIPEAQRLNNLAVDYLYGSGETSAFSRLAERSINYLEQALEVDAAYQMAQHNFNKLSYLLGRDAYRSLDVIDKREEEESYNQFNAIINSSYQAEALDSLNFYALNGLASIQYTLSRPDSACFYVDQMRENHFEQLSKWGQEMPYLGACQEGEASIENPADTVETETGEVPFFKVYAFPATENLYAPADNRFTQNIVNSLSSLGRNTTLQQWATDLNNRYDSTLIFDGFQGDEAAQLIFNQSPATGNNTAVLFYANQFNAYPDLRYPQQNAQGMDKALASIGFQTETRQISSARDFNNVLNNLRRRSYGPEDQLIIYISSYFYFTDGLDESRIPDQLIPTNGGLNDPGSGIDLDAFADAIGEISCNRILVIVDAFEIEDPNIQGEKPPIPTSADLINNFATYTQMIGPRRHSVTTGFIIDEVEGQLIVVAPYTRPSSSELGQYGPGHKIKFGQSSKAYDANLITDYPNEEIAFFSLPNVDQLQWEFDFSTSDLQVGQTINLPQLNPSVQRPPSEGEITGVGEEAFSVVLSSGIFEKSIALIDGRIAGLLTKSASKGRLTTGIPFDYIEALWENTMVTYLDQIAPPDQALADDLVFVKGGTFEMGDVFGDGEEDERPVHTVTLSDFYISDHEVTFEEYDAYCRAEGIDLPEDEGWGRGNRPVINVSWYDAVKYCNWRSTQAGLESGYTIKGENVTAAWEANGYRLPTEAEWEYAARSGGRKEKYAGTSAVDSLREYAHYDTSSTALVRSYLPNALGLYDMSGNVWEWCWDGYWENYYGSRNNPTGHGGGLNRVVRGGGWYDVSKLCRTTIRNAGRPGFRDSGLGFRLVLISR